MKAKAALLTLAIFLSACFPVRAGSDAQKTEIAVGATIGYRQGLVDAQLTAQQIPTVTPFVVSTVTVITQPAPQVASTPSVMVVTATPEPPPLVPPTLEPTALPEPWFWVTTTNKGWFSLFDRPGRTEQKSGNVIAVVGSNLVLPAYDRASGNHYYLVVVNAWAELRDLEEGGAGVWNTTKCDDHEWGHGRLMCHAHLYPSPNSSPDQLVGWVERGARIKVLEVDTYAKMAYIQLQPLWIDQAFTVH